MSDIKVMDSPKPESLDFIHLFCTSTSEYKKGIGIKFIFENDRYDMDKLAQKKFKD